MGKLFIVFDRRNGGFAALDERGIIRTVNHEHINLQVGPNGETALRNLHDGEYVYVGNHVVVCSTGGITMDELAARSINSTAYRMISTLPKFPGE